MELGRLWFVKYKRSIRGPFLGYSGNAAMYIKIRLYAEAGDPTGETWYDLGYGRGEGSRRQVPGLAAKTGEY